MYAKVVKLHQKYLKLIEANKNKNESKLKFQGQYARSKRWFHFGFDWTGVNFSTRELDFYNKCFRVMTIHNIQINLKYFKFQYEVQNVQEI